MAVQTIFSIMPNKLTSIAQFNLRKLDLAIILLMASQSTSEAAQTQTILLLKMDCPTEYARASLLLEETGVGVMARLLAVSAE